MDGDRMDRMNRINRMDRKDRMKPDEVEARPNGAPASLRPLRCGASEVGHYLRRRWGIESAANAGIPLSVAESPFTADQTRMPWPLTSDGCNDICSDCAAAHEQRHVSSVRSKKAKVALKHRRIADSAPHHRHVDVACTFARLLS